MLTLKSPMNEPELSRWWKKAVPATKHPLEDAGKWVFDTWALDGEGADMKICAMIQGEFEESELHCWQRSSA
jgi:nuclear RNA export factor